MSLIHSLATKGVAITVDELEDLTGCKVLLNGNRPEVALTKEVEVQLFKRFIKSTLSTYSPKVKERVFTHVWDHFQDAMERRAFARYFLEGWLSANEMSFAGLSAYSSPGLPADLIRPFVINSSGRSQSVADFGFGQVSTLTPWISMGLVVSAFDMNPFCVEAAQKSGVFSRVARIDGEYRNINDGFEIDSQSHDIVTTTLTLDRVSKPKRLLENMLACLRSRGYILVHTLLPIVAYDDGPELDSRIEYTKYEDRITSGQLAATDRNELTALLKSLGVRNIRAVPFAYSVASLDGSQTYVVCQLSGIKV
jgi:2-polyprenyl-3-methyl-5-hydroxy-6-metoxy-1,4-benzoquinol methylase